jgi:long-chain acyl-CoA synthetase
MQDNPPWLRFYDKVPASLEYPAATLYEVLAARARQVPDAIAWEFFGAQASYTALMESIDRCAAAMASIGLAKGDRLLISMPTSPQGVIAFYAANRLGVVPAMIHPLSTGPEITHYLNLTGARVALTLDAFYPALAAATPKVPLQTIVLARIPDYLPWPQRIGFWLTKGRRIASIPADPRVHHWSGLMDAATLPSPYPETSTSHPAAILFSGGTTALPKGVVLSNHNFIAQGLQAIAWCGMGHGDSILAILPIFHGFGLAVCVNAALMADGKSILVPQFSADIVARLIRTRRPNILVGVPTLFDALNRHPALAHADLSCLKVCFSGADTLSREVKERFEKLVADGGGRIKLMEGYGLTEAVSGIMAMPLEHYREGSIGVPFPDMLAKICITGSTDSAAPGAEGEICLSGPTLMQGYLNDAEATAKALRTHADGRVWLHTGDIGRMDTDGFFYFSSRLKRMIKSSGFNVYPAQVEAVLRQHPAVADACVIGVADDAQVERVVACVVLRDAKAAGEALAEALIAHCRERLIKWSCPREIDFVDSLPQTKVGKIDYRELVRRHEQRSATAQALKEQ